MSSRRRAWLFLVAIGACGGNGLPSHGDPPDAVADKCSGPGEGIPPPHCGEGPCSCCVGCGVGQGLCFGTASQFTFGVGSCIAAPGAGTLTATVGGAAFVADHVAAVVTGSYVQVSAVAGNRELVAMLPATIGTAACAASDYAGAFAYYQDIGVEFHNRPTQPRSACTVKLTKIGNLGDRIEGSFSVTVDGNTSLDVGNATFSVERVAFP